MIVLVLYHRQHSRGRDLIVDNSQQAYTVTSLFSTQTNRLQLDDLLTSILSYISHLIILQASLLFFLHRPSNGPLTLTEIAAGRKKISRRKNCGQPLAGPEKNRSYKPPSKIRLATRPAANRMAYIM